MVVGEVTLQDLPDDEISLTKKIFQLEKAIVFLKGKTKMKTSRFRAVLVGQCWRGQNTEDILENFFGQGGMGEKLKYVSRLYKKNYFTLLGA